MYSSLINEIKSSVTQSLRKYQLNYSSYYGVAYADILNSWSMLPLGLYPKDPDLEHGTSDTPSLNIIKSCIDTLVSKVAQQKVRPFFNTYDGDYKALKAVRIAQRFFDAYFDEEQLPEKMALCFKLAAIFDRSAIWFDQFRSKLVVLKPWEFALVPTEVTMGDSNTAFILLRQMPNSILKQYGYKGGAQKADVELVFENNRVTAFIEGREGYSKKYDKLPLSTLYYNSSLVGIRTISLCDELRGIQEEIDALMAKIKTASQLTFENMIIIPDTAGIQASALAGSSGYKIVKYMPTGTASPIEVIAPKFIDQSYMDLLDDLIEKAYNIAGISELSAQSRKPAGLDSGVALKSMESIETDRFETQLAAMVQSYITLTRVIISCFSIEPPKFHTKEWDGIQNSADNLTIQFSAQNAFSKDPSQKLKEILQLSQAGIIPQYKVPEFLEVPDLQNVYTIAMSKTYAAEQFIDDVVNGKVQPPIPPELDREVLTLEVVRLLNQLVANSQQESEEYVTLSAFWDALTLDMQANGIVPVAQDNSVMNVSSGGIAQSAQTGEQMSSVTPKGASGIQEPVNPDLLGNQGAQDA